MHKTWWEDKNLDENGNEPQCNTDEKEKADTPELGMDNVGGVFLVLGVGIAFSLLLGFLEFLWAVRQTSIEYKVICCNNYFSKIHIHKAYKII